MKKFLAVFLSIALILTAAGCKDDSGEEGENQTSQTEQTEGSNGENTGGVINGIAGTVFELSVSGPESVPVKEGIENLSDLTEEYSGGTVILKESQEASEKDDRAKLGMVKNGQLDIAIGEAQSFADTVKDLHIFDVYYLFDSREEAFTVGLKGETAKALEDSFEKKGLKLLALWGNGFREFASNTEVTRPSELKKLKVATYDSKTDIAAWKAMGAEDAVNTEKSGGDGTFGDKKSGGLDACLESMINSGLPDAVKYCTLTDHAFTPYVVVMNLDKFNSLSEVQRKALTDSMVYATDYQLERCGAYMDYALDVFEKSGTKVITLTKKQRDKFRDRAAKAKMRTKAKKLMDNPKLLKLLDAELEVYRMSNSKDED